MTNIVKTHQIREELQRNHQNWNFSFHNFLLTNGPGQPGPYQE